MVVNENKNEGNCDSIDNDRPFLMHIYYIIFYIKFLFKNTNLNKIKTYSPVDLVAESHFSCKAAFRLL